MTVRTARTPAVRGYPLGGQSEQNDDGEHRQQRHSDQAGADSGQQIGTITGGRPGIPVRGRPRSNRMCCHHLPLTCTSTPVTCITTASCDREHSAYPPGGKIGRPRFPLRRRTLRFCGRRRAAPVCAGQVPDWIFSLATHFARGVVSLLTDPLRCRRVIHNRGPVFAQKRRSSAGRPTAVLWINLWKLWISLSSCGCPVRARAVGACQDRAHG